jgi:hypothetical protein
MRDFCGSDVGEEFGRSGVLLHGRRSLPRSPPPDYATKLGKLSAMPGANCSICGFWDTKGGVSFGRVLVFERLDIPKQSALPRLPPTLEFEQRQFRRRSVNLLGAPAGESGNFADAVQNVSASTASCSCGFRFIGVYSLKPVCLSLSLLPIRAGVDRISTNNSNTNS